MGMFDKGAQQVDRRLYVIFVHRLNHRVRVSAWNGKRANGSTTAAELNATGISATGGEHFHLIFNSFTFG